MIPIKECDWGFVMKKRQKKQYRPIAGQRWYEKLLDWITREENLRWSIIGIWGYTGFMFLSICILTNVLELFDIADLFFAVWFRFLPVVVAVAAINPLSGIWDIRAEKRLQKPIKEYIEMHGHCTYDELVTQCMPVKIHLGIDSAIKKMLLQHDLVLVEDHHYRFPTDEDQKRWREERLEECGAKISFEDLERIFTLDLEELGESIDIEFTLGEHDGYWMGKTVDDSGTDIFWLMPGTGTQFDFTSFQEMSKASVFDERSLESVWDDVILTFINDHDMDFWLEAHLPTHD